MFSAFETFRGDDLPPRRTCFLCLTSAALLAGRAGSKMAAARVQGRVCRNVRRSGSVCDTSNGLSQVVLLNSCKLIAVHLSFAVFLCPLALIFDRVCVSLN